MKFAPMNPAPPVTRIFFIRQVSPSEVEYKRNKGFAQFGF
jgi:hypothetical protein